MSSVLMQVGSSAPHPTQTEVDPEHRPERWYSVDLKSTSVLTQVDESSLAVRLYNDVDRSTSTVQL